MKKTTKVEISNDLIEDLKKYSAQICVGMATQVRDDLYEAASYAINEFYYDYVPHWYQRHYWNFLKKSFEKYYKNPHSQIIRGGVYISSDEMSDVYAASVQQVFHAVWEEGAHGLPNDAPKIMAVPPIDLVYERRDYMVTHLKKYFPKAFKRAINANYKTLIKKG